MPEASSSFSLWSKEYARAGIPSSVRERPSHSLLRFLEFLQDAGITPASAVDIGCGKGRNTLELARRGARVVGLDGVAACIAELKDKARREQLEDRIGANCVDLRDEWPCASASADIAVDCFCFKHIVDTHGIEQYISSLSRVLKPGGHFLLTCAAKDDGYYGSLTCRSDAGPGLFVIDPENSIASRLYDPHELSELFSTLTLVSSSIKRSRNEMHDRQYERSTVICYFRR